MAVVDRLRSIIAGVAASRTERLLAQAAPVYNSIKLDNVEFEKHAAKLRELSAKIIGQLEHSDKVNRQVLALSKKLFYYSFGTFVIFSNSFFAEGYIADWRIPILKWIYPLGMDWYPVVILSFTFVIIALSLYLVRWRRRQNRIKFTSDVVEKRME